MPHDNHALADGEIGIAHISDLHFGCGKTGKDEEAWKLLEQILGAVKPSLLLVSGDLVDTPNSNNFAKAVQKLQGLGIPFHACLGNHDWFRKGNRFDDRLMFGHLRSRLVYLAVFLLIQWVAYLHFGPSALWMLFLLFPLPWVGPRLVTGLWNRVGMGLYDENLKRRILRHDVATSIKLPDDEAPEWTIGLLGIDSSAEANVSARGFVNPTSFSPLEQATWKQDWDLCICLVHHHQIPIRGLENRRRDDRLALLNLTTLVNSGSLLEVLVRAQVNLVLHGHEHEPNWAMYNTCAAGFEALRVVAAGSGTGMGEDGYSSDRATFNLIVLAPDRSIRLRRYHFQTDGWKTEEDVTLFDAATLRQSRLRRALAARQIARELTKYVEYTRERDIWVNWEYRNWLLPGGEFVQRIWNTTGEPDAVEARVWSADGGISVVPDNLTCKALEKTEHAWEIRWSVKPEWNNKPVIIRLGFRWRGGGVLTAEEMKHVRNGRRTGETPRLDGHEYETVWTPEAVSSAELIVVLPTEYAPDGPPAIRVEKVVEDRPNALTPSTKVRTPVPAAKHELRQHLSFPTRGKFALRVPYPIPYYDYTLSWEPVGEAAVAKLMANDAPTKHFQGMARLRGADLLKVFADTLTGCGYVGKAGLGLYVRDDPPGDLALHRTAWKGLFPPAATVADATTAAPNPAPMPPPPQKIPFRGEFQATTLAWWGDPQPLKRPEDEVEAGIIGFAHPAEQVLYAVPLRFNLQSATNPPPWGLLRIAILNQDEDLPEPKKIGKLLIPDDQMLRAAASALLSAAFRGVPQ